jgi:hypothetical protein
MSESDNGKPTKKFMTVGEYANHKGVSSATVYKRIREGAFTRRDSDGLIDVAYADSQWYSATSRVRITGMQSDESGRISQDVLDDKEKLIKERARKEALIAEKEEINLAKLKGTVIDKKKVEDLVYTISKQNAEAWLKWPNEVALELAGELDCDPSLLNSLLQREVRHQLELVATLRFDLESIAGK